MGLLLLLAVGAVSGCHTLSFYGQAIHGEYQLLSDQQPIQKLIDEPHTPPRLKQRLELLENMRAFAASDLKLPVDNQYRKYVDLHRPFVVWNVEAAPEFSLQAKTWWYPFLGSLDYRGYFSKPAATNYAQSLKKQGYDVSVGGVEAYSTLGWFKDPILNTFIFEPDAELAEIVFHELGHARLFARGDTDFNEAFATTVGEEGSQRWLKARGDLPALQAYRAHLHRNDQFVHLVMKTRTRLEALYGDEHLDGGKIRATNKNHGVPRKQLRQEKEAILADMRKEYAALKAGWGGNPEFDGWFAHEINNAELNSVAEYYDFVPGFQEILADNGGDMAKFYDAAEALSKKAKGQRHDELRALAKRGRATLQAYAAP